MPRRKKVVKSTIHVVKKTAEEYANSSTAHGIGYITEPNRIMIERCFWLFVVIMALWFRYENVYNISRITPLERDNEVKQS